MTKMFSLSVVCPDSHLHEVMSLLETLPVRHIMARPLPDELNLAQANAPAAVPPTQIERKGRHAPRANRSDPAFYAMSRASQAFLDSVTEPFTSREFARALKAVAGARTFNAGSRLSYYLQQGKLRKAGTRLYEVVK